MWPFKKKTALDRLRENPLFDSADDAYMNRGLGITDYWHSATGRYVYTDTPHGLRDDGPYLNKRTLKQVKDL